MIKAATRLSLLSMIRPRIIIFWPGNRPDADAREVMTRIGPYSVAARKVNLRAAKLRPTTLDCVAVGSVLTRADIDMESPYCSRS